MIPSPFKKFPTYDADEAARAAILHALPLVPFVEPSEVPGLLKEVGGIGNYATVEIPPDQALDRMLKLTTHMASERGFTHFTVDAQQPYLSCVRITRSVTRGVEQIGLPCWIWHSSDRVYVAVDPISADQLRESGNSPAQFQLRFL
jgi:hypothetical protein